jgi:hypothetical protein
MLCSISSLGLCGLVGCDSDNELETVRCSNSHMIQAFSHILNDHSRDYETVCVSFITLLAKVTALSLNKYPTFFRGVHHNPLSMRCTRK